MLSCICAPCASVALAKCLKLLLFRLYFILFCFDNEKALVLATFCLSKFSFYMNNSYDVTLPTKAMWCVAGGVMTSR